MVFGAAKGVLFIEVSSIQGVLLIEVSSFQGVLFIEVSSFQGVLFIGGLTAHQLIPHNFKAPVLQLFPSVDTHKHIDTINQATSGLLHSLYP